MFPIDEEAKGLLKRFVGQMDNAVEFLNQAKSTIAKAGQNIIGIKLDTMIEQAHSIGDNICELIGESKRPISLPSEGIQRILEISQRNLLESWQFAQENFAERILAMGHTPGPLEYGGSNMLTYVCPACHARGQLYMRTRTLQPSMEFVWDATGAALSSECTQRAYAHLGVAQRKNTETP